MADSKFEIMSDDNLLEDFSALVNTLEVAKDFEIYTGFDKNGHLIVVDKPKQIVSGNIEYNYLLERMAKLESQIGRILINLGIARKDEIVVTSEMPTDKSD